MHINNKNYTIVTEPDLADSNIITPVGLEDELEELYYKSKKGKSSIKQRLQKLIKRYPKFPTLRNYLVVWYAANGLKQEASKINDELLTLFPDYLFAITYKMAELIGAGKINEAGELLNGKTDIGEFYPDRKAFHLSEFRTFISAVVYYLSASYRFEEADAQIALLDEVEIDDTIVDSLHMTVTRYRLEKGAKRMQEYEDARIVAIERDDYTIPERDVKMEPMYPQFEFLYCDQWKIDLALLRDSIENNKELLILELRHILLTAVEGYGYINEKDEWSAAVLHALLILPYLDDQATFPAVMDLLRQPRDCSEYWLVDWEGDLLKRYFKNISEAKLQQIFSFMTESPGVTFSKITIISLLPNFVLNDPGSRETLIQFLKTLLHHFIINRNDENLFDSNVVAFIVGAAVDLKAIELLDVIGDMYAKGWVSLNVEGDFDEVKNRILSDKKTLNTVFFDDVFTHLYNIYDGEQKNEETRLANMMYHTKNEISDFFDDEDDESENDIYLPAKTNIFAGVSRNAPCPCGSGKKYKRCHGK